MTVVRLCSTYFESLFLVPVIKDEGRAPNNNMAVFDPMCKLLLYPTYRDLICVRSELCILGFCQFFSADRISAS